MHFICISDDPHGMWTKLESVHPQKRPGARFNAYDALFSIRKSPGESLTAVMTRIDAAMEQIQNLHPEKFTLDQMNKELVCMAMIRSLPPEYSSFASSLQLLDKFEKTKLQEAFVAEEILRSRSNMQATPPSASVLAVSTPPSSNNLVCEFCSLTGHSQDTCHRYRISKTQAVQDAQKRAQERRKNRTRGGRGSANAATTSDTPATAAAV